MKLCIFVMMVAVSIAACGGGRSEGSTFLDSAHSAPSETENKLSLKIHDSESSQLENGPLLDSANSAPSETENELSLKINDLESSQPENGPLLDSAHSAPSETENKLSLKINDSESSQPKNDPLLDSANVSNETKNKVRPKKNGKKPADRRFIAKQDVAELVVRKTLDAYHFVAVAKPSQVRCAMYQPDAPHLQLRRGMEYLISQAPEADDQLWSKKYAVATYIYVLNTLSSHKFKLPFKRERAFLPLEKIESEEIERAKRVIVFFQQKANGKCPEPIGLRYFEENDPEFHKNDPQSSKSSSSASGNNENQRGWYITTGKSWKALDSTNSDTQVHINWLHQNTEIIDSLIYFKADELSELETAVRNLGGHVSANETLFEPLGSITFHEDISFMD